MSKVSSLLFRSAGVVGLALSVHNYISNRPGGDLTAGTERFRNFFATSSSSSSDGTVNLSQITLLSLVKYLGSVTFVTVSVFGVWQTYAFFYNMLPEYMTGVLPVTTSAFNIATSKLAKGDPYIYTHMIRASNDTC